jgi:hypothetical protein
MCAALSYLVYEEPIFRWSLLVIIILMVSIILITQKIFNRPMKDYGIKVNTK